MKEKKESLLTTYKKSDSRTRTFGMNSVKRRCDKKEKKLAHFISRAFFFWRQLIMFSHSCPHWSCVGHSRLLWLHYYPWLSSVLNVLDSLLHFLFFAFFSFLYCVNKFSLTFTVFGCFIDFNWIGWLLRGLVLAFDWNFVVPHWKMFGRKRNSNPL